MREIEFNGYIDSDVIFGDEITPELFHEILYGDRDEMADDVAITLNSYGGDCNAAVRIYDDIRAYKGSVQITISGTAASAGTIVASAADRLAITPGSLMMVHDPSMIVGGNARELAAAIDALKACKDGILNIYQQRVGDKLTRDELDAMMAATTWMDASAALANGFVDAIAETKKGSVQMVDAVKGAKDWIDRRMIKPVEDKKVSVLTADERLEEMRY